jgi:membrane protein YdbS with pleckstrin-like domain
MNRSKDLDTIAPDDEIIISSSIPETKTIDPPKKEEIKIKNKIKSVIDTSTENFDQKVYDILGHTKSPFSSFLVFPKVLKFTEQDDSEKIYLATRPHWITNISWILISIIMIFVPAFLKYFSFLDFFNAQYLSAIVLFWYLITFAYAFENFLSWYFDLFIITNERVVDIQFNNLLNKHFAEADIDMIQDVSSSVRGVMGTFFNYGNVLIQTASEVNQITFENVANPEKIIKLLKELRDLEEGDNK